MGNTNITSFCSCQENPLKEEFKSFESQNSIENGKIPSNKMNTEKRKNLQHSSEKSLSVKSFDINNDKSDLKSLIELETSRLKSQENKKTLVILDEEKNNYYEGYTIDGMYNGYGLLKINNILFKGTFENGKKSGLGEIRSYPENELIFKGDFKNDLKNGKGHEFDEDSEYLGNFVNDKREGLGVLKMKNGTIYEGNFKNGEIQGHGTLFWSETKYYTGEFVNGKLNGIGKFIQEGVIYRGFYKNSQKHGLGHIIYPSKKINIIGNFKNDVIEGYAILLNDMKEEQRLYFREGKQIECFSVNKKEEESQYARLKEFYLSYLPKLKIELNIEEKRNMKFATLSRDKMEI